MCMCAHIIPNSHRLGDRLKDYIVMQYKKKKKLLNYTHSHKYIYNILINTE